MKRVYKNFCPATISASIMAANMWKNILKNVASDNNKILYETLLETVLTFWISLVVIGELQTAEVAYFQRKNSVIRIFCITGWLAVPINPGKWSFTGVTFFSLSLSLYIYIYICVCVCVFVSSLQVLAKILYIFFISPKLHPVRPT